MSMITLLGTIRNILVAWWRSKSYFFYKSSKSISALLSDLMILCEKRLIKAVCKCQSHLQSLIDFIQTLLYFYLSYQDT